MEGGEFEREPADVRLFRPTWRLTSDERACLRQPHATTCLGRPPRAVARELASGKPARNGMHEPPRRDEVRDHLAGDRPGEPGSHLVLVREDRGAYAEDDELFERGVLRRLPWLSPHLIPARHHARMAVAAFAVLDRHSSRDDRAVTFEALTHFA